MEMEKLVEYTAVQLYLQALRLAEWQMCSCIDHYQPRRERIYLLVERLIKAD